MSINIRKKKLKSGKQSLYLDIYHNGQRQYEFLELYLTGDRTHDKEVRQLAESIRAKRQLEIQNSTYGFTPSFKRKANFVAYLEKLADQYKEKGNKSYQNVLNYVKKHSGDRIQFAAINKGWIQDFKQFIGEQVSTNTANLYFSVLKATLNRAVKDDIIPFNPADKVDNFEKEDTLIHYLTIDELGKIKGTDTKPELKRAFFFSCNTGLRFSDVKRLKWQDVKNGQIEFKQQKTTGADYIPLNRQAKKLLGEAGKPGEQVFDLPDYGTVYYLINRWGEDANLTKKLNYHMSRHTFAVQFLAAGGDIYTLKELLGHKSLRTTEVYAKVVNKTKENAVNKLPEMGI